MEFSEDDKVKESGEEMEETEESEDEMEETEESEDEIAKDNNDPDWSVLDEIGEENRYDDEENDDETNTYIRCVCVCVWGGGGDGTKFQGNDSRSHVITFYRVEKDTPCKDKPKFLVFYSRLLALFSLFCFNCKEGNPHVRMKSNGTVFTVYQDCKNCGSKGFQWRSQPLVLGKYPAGNILLSFAILMAGGSVAIKKSCKLIYYKQANISRFLPSSHSSTAPPTFSH